MVQTRFNFDCSRFLSRVSFHWGLDLKVNKRLNEKGYQKITWIPTAIALALSTSPQNFMSDFLSTTTGLGLFKLCVWRWKCAAKKNLWRMKREGNPPWRKVLQSLFSIKQSFPHLVLEGSSTLYPINRGMAHKSWHCPAQQTESESETKAEVVQHSTTGLQENTSTVQEISMAAQPDRVVGGGGGGRRVYLAIMRPLAHIPPCTPRGLGIGNKTSQNFTAKKCRFGSD